MSLAFRTSFFQALLADGPIKIKPDQKVGGIKVILCQLSEYAFGNPGILLLGFPDHQVHILLGPFYVKPAWFPKDIIQMNDRDVFGLSKFPCQPRLTASTIAYDDHSHLVLLTQRRVNKGATFARFASIIVPFIDYFLSVATRKPDNLIHIVRLNNAYSYAIDNVVLTAPLVSKPFYSFVDPSCSVFSSTKPLA
jgi:hypothetical protein